MKMKTSEIKFNVTVDENHLPVKLTWKAQDSGADEEQECKSVMLSIWDAAEQNTLRIDLWTKDMMVDEMKLFFHQTLVSMANTLERATGDLETSKDVREFATKLAEKMNLIVDKK